MICIKAIKFRLYPNVNQQIQLNKTFGCARLVYNLSLAERINSYKETKTFACRNYTAYYDEYPFLREVESQALNQSLQDLNKAFRNCFSKTRKTKNSFPKFKTKKSKQSYRTCVMKKDCIDFDRFIIIIPKCGEVKIRGKVKCPKEFKIKNLTISKTPTNKYFVSACVEYENQVFDRQLDTNNSVGLDYSSHDFFVSNEGEFGNYPRFFRQYETKLAKEQKKFSKMTPGSNNWRKQKIKIAGIYEKNSNSRLNFCHQLSSKLANKYDYVFVEDINLQNISQGLTLGKSTMDNGFGMFRNFLQYKLEDRGKVFKKIDKWSPTTVVCSACGCYHKDIVNSLSVRHWKCPDCGAEHDRDINAAENIRLAGLALV